ncbi:MAG: hypothetical protein ACO3O3_13525 [Ilumatobacteraceae bacterium]|jgi:hypothetical protein
MENQTNQLADLIMAIIQEKVDERIEQKVNDLQEGMNSTSFDIYDHSSEIADMIDEHDIDHKITDWFGNNTFSVTVD